MNPKIFYKELAKATKAQATINAFFDAFNDHFFDLEIYDFSITYCEGDGFLLLDSRGKGKVYQIKEVFIEKIFSFKTSDELFAYIDELDRSCEGV